MAINKDDKEKALQEALNHINKQYGQGAIMKLGDDNMITNVETISTGSISLDIATGIGGIPKGRVIEV